MSEPIESSLMHISAQIARTNGYLARAEMDRLLQSISRDPKRLEPFGFKVYSQNDEDGIIEEIFRRIGVESRRFVEIGVDNGLECNTLYLIHRGWTGVWIEGNLSNRELIQEKFSSILESRLDLALGWVTAENINQVLSRMSVESDIDFLSIDIDGNDIYILESIELRPKVICIEYNSKFPPGVSKKPSYDPNWVWRGTDYMGSSLKAISLSACDKGYQLVGTNLTGSNAFFVRNDLVGDLFPENSSPEALYNPPRYWLWDHFVNVGHRPDFGPYIDLVDSSPT